MSFDLLVFDPSLAPADDQEFDDWYKSLVRWDRPEDYSDPKTSSPALQLFFDHLSKTFPPKVWSEDRGHEPFGKEGILARSISRLLGWKRQHEFARELPEDFDEACFTDYSFGKAAIYLGFAWSVSEQALHATIDAALRSHVGLYDVSAEGARPIRKQKDLLAIKNQTFPAAAPSFSKADLFKMLKEDGWTVTRDPDDGSRFATRIEKERVFGLLPSVRKTSDGTRIEWREGVVPLKYLRAISKIQGENHVFYPLGFRNGTRSQKQYLTPQDAKMELGRIMTRLQEEDLTQAITKAANLPLSSPGNAPLQLLAAKACRGDYFELCRLRDEMRSGNRQGFVPYIQVEHLERAVEACAELNEHLS